MTCTEFCASHSTQLIEETELCSLSLQIFLRAHYLLKNFVDFFKFHSCTCADTSYDKIPLHGALDIVATAMTSRISGKMLAEESQRLEMFHDVPGSVQCRPEADVPEDIVQKVDTLLRCLQKSCAIERIMCQVKNLLHCLEISPACLMSDRLRSLSICLKGVMNRLVCSDQTVEGSSQSKQIKLLTLNLVNNFIRDWCVKRSRMTPTLRICRFCDRVVSETTRQWGTFCCKQAQQFHLIWKEWSLEQSISQDTEKVDWIDEEVKRQRFEDEIFTEFDKDSSAMYLTKKRRSRAAGTAFTKGEKISGKEEGSVGGKVAEAKKLRRSKGVGKGDKSVRGRSRKGRRGGSVDDDAESTYEERSVKRSGKKKGGKASSKESGKERRARKADDGGQEGSATDRRKRGKKKHARDEDTEADDATIKSKGRRKKMETSDSEDRAASPTADEKGKTSKGGRKRADLDSTKKRRLSHGQPIEYQLSNQQFVKLGWTMLPVVRMMRQIVHYQAKPAKPHLHWSKKIRYPGQLYYDDHFTTFTNFRKDGSGSVFYPNGKLAIEVFKPKHRKYDMYTVFSPGGKDSAGIERHSQIVALFDTMGNGIIFDQDGETRLSYNHVGGIWRDNPTGLPMSWMWDKDDDKTITKTMYVEKSATHLEKLLPPLRRFSSGSTKRSLSPTSSRNKEKKGAREESMVLEHLADDGDEGEEEEEETVIETGVYDRKRYSKGTCHFKRIYMKLNDYISFRILSRSSIRLHFSVGKQDIRIELGTVLDLNKELDRYFVDSSSGSTMLRGKYETLLESHLEPDDYLYRIAKELRNLRKSGRQRRFLMDKYRPFWSAWKRSGTRCRPR